MRIEQRFNVWIFMAVLSALCLQQVLAARQTYLAGLDQSQASVASLQTMASTLARPIRPASWDWENAALKARFAYQHRNQAPSAQAAADLDRLCRSVSDTAHRATAWSQSHSQLPLPPAYTEERNKAVEESARLQQILTRQSHHTPAAEVTYFLALGLSIAGVVVGAMSALRFNRQVAGRRGAETEERTFRRSRGH